MDLKDFIERFVEAVEIEDASSLSENTLFRELDEWNSLAALSLIAMLDEEYGIQIETPQFSQLKTIGDIFNYINIHK